MIWAIVGGVILLLIIVGSIRSRRQRGSYAAPPTPEAPRDLSRMAGGSRLLDASGAPLTESHTIQVHQAKYFPPATTLLSDEGVRLFAEPLMEAAERAAAAQGAPTDFERYCIMVREDHSMNLLLKWSAPIPARVVHAVAQAMDAQARALGGRPGSA